MRGRRCLLLGQPLPKGCIWAREHVGHSTATAASGAELCHEPPPAARAPALLLPLHLAPFPRLAGSFAFITSEYLILAARAHRLYMLSLDKAQISLLSAARPRQPFPASPERCHFGMLPVPPTRCSSRPVGCSPRAFRACQRSLHRALRLWHE